MVPRAGLEPAQLSLLPPQDSVSTNSTTWALFVLVILDESSYPEQSTTRFAWPLLDSCLSRHLHSCASSTNSTTWALFVLVILDESSYPEQSTTRFAWPLLDSCLKRHLHSCASTTNSTTWDNYLVCINAPYIAETLGKQIFKTTISSLADLRSLQAAVRL